MVKEMSDDFYLTLSSGSPLSKLQRVTSPVFWTLTPWEAGCWAQSTSHLVARGRRTRSAPGTVSSWETGPDGSVINEAKWNTGELGCLATRFLRNCLWLYMQHIISKGQHQLFSLLKRIPRFFSAEFQSNSRGFTMRHNTLESLPSQQPGLHEFLASRSSQPTSSNSPFEELQPYVLARTAWPRSNNAKPNQTWEARLNSSITLIEMT